MSLSESQNVSKICKCMQGDINCWEEMENLRGNEVGMGGRATLNCYPERMTPLLKRKFANMDWYISSQEEVHL